MRVLIICPQLKQHGGVANYFKAILKHLSIKTDIFQVGSYSKTNGILYKFKKLKNDNKKLYSLLKTNSKKYDLIHINPSLLHGSLFRDGILLRTFSQFDIKSIVFFRGWERSFEHLIDQWFFRIFYSTYNKTNAFIVLASIFKKKLRKWGFKQPIYLETTVVDDDLIKGFSMQKKLRSIDNNNMIQILHMARIDNLRKGIIVSLEAFARISYKYANIRLVIAGDGNFLDKAKQYSMKIGLKDKVSFLGHIEGKKKAQVLEKSDLFLLPTFSNEGMPNSVLEAMSFGIPLITSPVAGLNDILINGRHGIITKNINPALIALNIEKLIFNKNLRKKMSILNNKVAADRFLASKVAKRLENIYEKTL